MSDLEAPQVEASQVEASQVEASQVEAPADVLAVPDAALRGMLEFAIGIAAAGVKRRPPLSVPPRLKPYFKYSRLDRGALTGVRRCLNVEVSFRTQLAQVATAEMVGPLGVIWLQRPDGWIDTAVALYEQELREAKAAHDDTALKRAERRRQAAETLAMRAQSEVLVLTAELRRERSERAALQAQLSAEQVGAATATDQLNQARRELTKVAAQLSALSVTQIEADEALRVKLAQVTGLERQRDELLAERFEPLTSHQPLGSGSENTERALKLLGVALSAAKELTSQIQQAATVIGTVEIGAAPNSSTIVPARRPQRRQPIAIPGGLYGNSAAVALHFLRTPGAEIIVDGYNLAKQTWPRFELAHQRECCLDLLENLARRFSCRILVVFDGADVVAANTTRRLIRVQFSPSGTIADDVIRMEVGRLAVSTPVVVVTDDQGIVASVKPMGANVISCAQLVTATSSTR